MFDDFDERVAGVFASLEQNYQPYRDEPDPDTRRQLLWGSHAGVPFWEKWGAVPGALVVYFLQGELGHEGVAGLIEHEPLTIFITYAEIAATHPDWPPLPEALVDDARAALRSHQRAVEESP